MRHVGAGPPPNTPSSSGRSGNGPRSGAAAATGRRVPATPGRAPLHPGPPWPASPGHPAPVRGEFAAGRRRVRGAHGATQTHDTIERRTLRHLAAEGLSHQPLDPVAAGGRPADAFGHHESETASLRGYRPGLGLRAGMRATRNTVHIKEIAPRLRSRGESVPEYGRFGDAAALGETLPGRTRWRGTMKRSRRRRDRWRRVRRRDGRDPWHAGRGSPRHRCGCACG